LAIPDGQRHNRREDSAGARESEWHHEIETGVGNSRVAKSHGAEFQRIPSAGKQSINECNDMAGWFGESIQPRLEGHTRAIDRGNQPGRNDPDSVRSTAAPSTWGDFDLIYCRDEKYRRVERGSFPLAHGVPRDMGRRKPELRSMAKRARSNRVGRLKGYGNAIVPAVAAEFIRAVMNQ